MKKVLLILCGLFLVGCGDKITTPATQDPFVWEMVSDNTDKYILSYPRFTAGPTAIIDSLNTDLPNGVASFVNQADSQTEMVAPWELKMTPAYQYTDDTFTSLLIDTYDFSGGEQGNVYYGVVNYDVLAQKFIGLSDLFTDETYLRPLADFVRSEISLIKQGQDSDYGSQSDEALIVGTQPDLKNFKVFTFIDGPEGRGLYFKFTENQVGFPNKAAQEILVPVGILSEFVKPEYRSWFVPVELKK